MSVSEKNVICIKDLNAYDRILMNYGYVFIKVKRGGGVKLIMHVYVCGLTHSYVPLLHVNSA